MIIESPSFVLVSQEITISQTPPPTPNDYQHQRSEEDANGEYSYFSLYVHTKLLL